MLVMALTCTVPMHRAAAGQLLRIVVLGDSLVAGHGLAADATFPVKLEKALVARNENKVLSGKFGAAREG